MIEQEREIYELSDDTIHEITDDAVHELGTADSDTAWELSELLWALVQEMAWRGKVH